MRNDRILQISLQNNAGKILENSVIPRHRACSIRYRVQRLKNLMIHTTDWSVLYIDWGWPHSVMMVFRPSLLTEGGQCPPPFHPIYHLHSSYLSPSSLSPARLVRFSYSTSSRIHRSLPWSLACQYDNPMPESTLCNGWEHYVPYRCL
jgi:hypothetical protein